MIEKKKRPIVEEDEDHIPLKSLLEASKSKSRVAKVVDPNKSVNPLEPIESVQSPLGDLIVEIPVLTLAPSGDRNNRMSNHQEQQFVAPPQPAGQPGAPSRIQVEESVQAQPPSQIPPPTLFTPEQLKQLAAAVADQLKSNNPWPDNEEKQAESRGPSVVEQRKKDLQTQIDEMKAMLENGKKAKGKSVVEPHMMAFSQALLDAEMPQNFLMPKFQEFSGSENPRDHISAFSNALQFYSRDGNVFARAFPLSLTGNARTWFTKLPQGSIDSWDSLIRKFMTKFGSKITTDREEDALLEIKQ